MDCKTNFLASCMCKFFLDQGTDRVSARELKNFIRRVSEVAGVNGLTGEMFKAAREEIGIGVITTDDDWILVWPDGKSVRETWDYYSARVYDECVWEDLT